MTGGLDPELIDMLYELREIKHALKESNSRLEKLKSWAFWGYVGLWLILGAVIGISIRI